jgi:hypothetical protein
MVAEIFKIDMPARILVFVAALRDERFEYLGRALENMGAAAIGPRAYSLREGLNKSAQIC